MTISGDILELVGVIVAALLGILALFTYLRDVEHKRTDWLYRLFESFYKEPTYRRVRALLDGPGATQLRDVLGKSEPECTPDDHQLIEGFCDYLNFFEFMCNLVEKRRMSPDDLNRLFDYYLNNLARQGIGDYLSENGYEALARELGRRA